MKKILLSLTILAVMGLTANVQAQCNGASVSITNLSINPTHTSVSYSFSWQYVNGNASIQVQFLCDGVLQASGTCIPRLTDSAAGVHNVSGNQSITCNGVLRVQVVIWTNPNCGGTNCVAAFREVTQSTLPVDFKSFTATRNRSNVLLKWETSTEKNNTGFAVERNTIGSWEQIAWVATQAPGGNSNDILSYTYNDLNDAKGVSQYRIRQVDFDARSKYSEIRSVRGEDQKGQITVYPNPSLDGKVNIVFENGNVIRDVSVIDMNGRTVKLMKGVTNTSVTVENLVPGMYTIKVVVPSTGDQIVQKIVVNKL